MDEKTQFENLNDLLTKLGSKYSFGSADLTPSAAWLFYELLKAVVELNNKVDSVLPKPKEEVTVEAEQTQG